MFAEVLVQYGVKSLDKTFTYVVPINLRDKLKVGMKVTVPFATKNISGFVTNIKSNNNEEIELKEIVDIVDPYLVLSDELLKLGEYLKSRTLCSLITAYQTMLPSSLKVKNTGKNYEKYDTYIELNKSEVEVYDYIDRNPRSKKQKEILELLLVDHSVLKSEIAGEALRTLLKLELVKEKFEQKYRIDYGYVENVKKVTLTDDQQRAVDKISSSLDIFKTFLIHGITGSGKTEIYMALIDEVVSKGKSAILLVPEISLTTQIITRFYERFGNKVAIFHSALSDGEKYDEYLKILRGEIKIVIGTRSSIFTPVSNLGIVIVDEEHSENYKQESNPRYHAFDMAEYRAKYNNVPLVLGSATPTLESMARAKKGVYELITIDKRIGESVLPDVNLVDMALEMKQGNMIFSDMLKKKIANRLDRGEQIILLLNRRGFSTFITCSNCGFSYKCPHCDITLTYHKTTNNLRCHYCGYTVIKDNKCPECSKDALNYFGLGTEKLEAELKELFPSSKIIRMDADTTSKKGSHAKIIEKFKNQEYDILLGTQMISKGLDFPKVTLVGVISADNSLNIPDFRSGERTFQLLSQVAGRAGRSDLKGEVVIQTFNPDNYTLDFVSKNDYGSFYNYEMDIRRKLGYPPYYYLVGVKIASKIYDAASKEATKVGNYLKNNLGESSVVLGPTTASMFRINNIYRFSIMIKYKKDDKLLEVLKDLDLQYVSNRDVNIEIDINPNRI